ncbi:MAG: aminotransferase class I/II-fold pyridoxal phosphate-dependent enzyme, partial [Planctomycetota bacterium]
LLVGEDSILRPEDRVLSDEQNHASTIDGLRLTKAKRTIYPHLDLDALERELKTPHDGRTVIVTESLFSMDGDIAPLDRLADLAAHYDASLVVDDAHATGVFGDERGSGLIEQFGVEDRVDAVTSTFGKALGFFGAFVTGPRPLIDWLVSRARSFIFSTAPPPIVLAGMEAALDVATSEPERRGLVLARADELRRLLRSHGLDCLQSRGPIVPVVVGGNERSLRIAASIQARGFDVRAIRPPSVAPGTSRLRVCVHADHCEETISSLAVAISEAFRASP